MLGEDSDEEDDVVKVNENDQQDKKPEEPKGPLVKVEEHEIDNILYMGKGPDAKKETDAEKA